MHLEKLIKFCYKQVQNTYSSVNDSMAKHFKFKDAAQCVDK